MTNVALGVVAAGPAADAIGQHVPTLVADRFASRLFARDATLWGAEAESEAAIRLSWTGLPRSSRPLVGEVAALRDHLREQGLDHVVLCGMGGSSLAPEVICATAGVELTVLDSSSPDMVRSALSDRLERTVVVVSSKSGSTVETDSQRRAYEAAFTEAGIDPAGRIVVVTDPGSPLDREARAAGYHVVNADPEVGGRYSALTAFGLVPSGLAGADLEALLDEAESVSDLLAEDDEANPGLRLAAAMAGTSPLRDKLAIIDSGSGIVGFADWAEQLIAESTGKQGTGILPVVVGERRRPRGALARGRRDGRPPRRRLRGRGPLGRDARQRPSALRGPRRGSLGAQMLLWEVAIAVGRPPAGHQPVRPARRRERQEGRPGPARRRRQRPGEGRLHRRRHRGPHPRRRLARFGRTIATALDALFDQLDPTTATSP